jgi:RHH-type proline utilization regulon transcriptional repressor/proline dehydrogenase/delta 1-pyrroline-5-carboxylate dehydrogenase
MVVDSTAQPEQAVRDILASAFQSAGQRCSALRCLYLQDEVADGILHMLKGAMDQLRPGDPWEVATDLGPVIDAEAAAGIVAHVAGAKVLHRLAVPETGHFVAPVVVQVGGIADIPREVFGPVLHVARFRAAELPAVYDAINARGYGLTFGLHSRIDGRVQQAVAAVRAGNLYVNRNMIGAVVGSQPFGGEGLSGTGPKAGGPDYVARLAAPAPAPALAGPAGPADLAGLAARLGGATGGRVVTLDLPGPTGESNRLTLSPRAPVLCLGPGAAAEAAQVAAVAALGGVGVAAGGLVPADWLATAPGFSGAVWWGDEATARALAAALARRDGPILPLITDQPDRAQVLHERHLCIDTTAAGGNAHLLAAAARAA